MAPLEFPAEVAPRSAIVVRHSAIVPVAAATTSTRPAAGPVPLSSRRLLWLVAVFAACAPLAWIALRDSESVVPQQASTPVAAPASQPRAELVLAPASPPSAPIQAPPSPERRPARPRNDTSSRPRPARQPDAREAAPPAAAAASAAFHGALVIDSEPPGARVFVNGQAAGSTPLILEQVPVGSRVVRVEADAYEPWSSAVRVVANEQTHVVATLRR